jgi:serine/threonine protein kinase
MIGKTLSHYRITEQLGKGGMGEVYLAEDTTLDRRVALKFLPEAFTSDPERMARFEREAKLLASLNHPNIAGIYGLEQADGNRFLVLEYVEGETLQTRLKKGALPLEDTLALCRQIAEGLEAAHEKGVIHRDLKPANVMITAEEKVKILDFGLAKALTDETQSIDPADSPTITDAMTQPGVVLGTAAYMSPEQAKGKSVDKRADIWAFGCILYECLTGKKAFEGETVTETLAAILRGEPDWEALPSTTPQNIRFVLRRSLEKEKNRRLRDIGDIQIEIEEARHIGGVTTLAKKSHPWLAWSIATFFIIAFGIVSVIYFREKSWIPPDAIRMKFKIAENLDTRWWNYMALSPDGNWLAFNAPGPDYSEVIWIRAMNSLEAKPLSGTESNSDRRYFLFWSPDSRSIAFDADTKLKTIDISSGAVKTVCNIPLLVVGGSWNHDGEIILGMLRQGIMRVSAKGGELTPLTHIDQEQPESVHISPTFLPNGRNFLYSITSDYSGTTGIYVGSLDSKLGENDSKQILGDNFVFRYAPLHGSGTGYLLYLQDSTLFAQLFDEKTLEIIGESFPVIEQVSFSGTDALTTGNFTISNNGVLIYQDARNLIDSEVNQELSWVDRTGKKISQTGPSGKYSNFRLSRDEKKIVFDRVSNSGNWDIWLLDLIRGISSRLTNHPAVDNLPMWSPDSSKVLFPSLRDGPFNLYIKASTGAGQAELLIKLGTDNGWGTDWTRDERFILYQMPGHETGQDLWIAPQLDDKEPYPYLNKEYNEQDGTFSPDGKWIAYVSNETGWDEIYVQSFPLSETKFTISTDGGSEPYWSDDGTELFYVSTDRNLMAIPITLNPRFYPGVPKPLFPVPVKASRHSYAVSKDSKRFLIIDQTEEQKADLSIIVVVNWTSLLEQ